MEVEGLPLDRISSLPPNIIQHILTLMPLEDAFRTSVLSRSWRDHCLNIPKLTFDDALFQGSSYKTVSIKCKLLHIVYPILLLHQGAMLEFSLSLFELESCREIDQIILHLSRNATLKEFTLRVGSGDEHKLLPAFFKLQQLTVLKLENCAFQPPVSFKGFSRLVTLSIDSVSINVEVFLRFLSNCPLLKHLTLIGDTKHLMGCWNSDFVECLPLVEDLCMSFYPITFFARSVMPEKLPAFLVHLKHLRIPGRYSFEREIDLLCAYVLVTINSSTMETILMEMPHCPGEAMPPGINFDKYQNHPCIILHRLRVITITNFLNIKTEMDFVKFIVARSPMLKEVHIVVNKRVDIHDEVKMLKELL